MRGSYICIVQQIVSETLDESTNLNAVHIEIIDLTVVRIFTVIDDQVFDLTHFLQVGWREKIFVIFPSILFCPVVEKDDASGRF